MLVVAALVAATPVHAYAQQRLSLADRVTRLELQGDNSQANADLLNQLNQLRAEVVSLRQAVEQLQHEKQQLQQSARDQYLDLDGRLNRLESGGAPALPAPPDLSAAPVPRASAPVAAPAATEAPPSVHGDPGSLAQAGDERAAYDAAFKVMSSGNYKQAVQQFEAFLAQYPNGIYAPNALYWLGQSYYLTSRYAEAEQQFEAVVARYPTHPKAADSMLKLGLAQMETGKPELAERTLVEVGSRYPGTEAARIAGDRLGSLSRRSY